LTQGYDLIGDIHGHADELKALLEKLGYSLIQGCYRHPARKVVFLGDFIDRGPKQRDVLQTVMPMVQQGAALAVMGNHEFNALAYHTENPNKPGTWLRPRNNKNTQQHIAFLNEYLSNARNDELGEVIDFFWSLPLWLELDGFRVVHACWEPHFVASMTPRLKPNQTLTAEILIEASTKGEAAYEAIEALLKGVEYTLPDGKSFKDSDKNTRHAARTKWWKNDDATLEEAAFLSGIMDEETLKIPVSANELVGYPSTANPVFLGHYWMRDRPEKMADNVAILDYAVAKGGKLVAYRWDGEARLDDSNFTYLD
jgi:hypothetical protein